VSSLISLMLGGLAKKIKKVKYKEMVVSLSVQGEQIQYLLLQT